MIVTATTAASKQRRSHESFEEVYEPEPPGLDYNPKKEYNAALYSNSTKSDSPARTRESMKDLDFPSLFSRASQNTIGADFTRSGAVRFLILRPT